MSQTPMISAPPLVPAVKPRRSVRKKTHKPLGQRLILVSRAVRDCLNYSTDMTLTRAQRRVFKGPFDLERGLFVYVVYVELGEALAEVAALSGLSATTIKELVASVEDLREACVRTDRLIVRSADYAKGGGHGRLL